MTPSQFADKMDRIARALPREVAAAERDTLRQTKTALVNRSSGNITSGQLAKMGHPYGRSMSAKIMRTVARIEPSAINIQSGAFVKNWRMQPTRSPGRVLTNTVINTTMFGEYTAAQIMEGTVHMVARRVDTYVLAKMKPIRRANLRSAYQRALKA